MFDFLFQNKKGELYSYIDTISVEIQKLALSELAIEKAVGMIAKAIAKSEFIVERNHVRTKDDVYWLLNIQPNPNETATDFWISAIRKLLLETECVICLVNGNMYIVDSYTINDVVMLPQTYSNIVITSNEKTLTLRYPFQGNNIIHLKARNEKIKGYLKKVLNLYNNIASAVSAAKKIESTPKFSLDIEGAAPLIRTKNPDGTDKTLTIDQYRESVKKLLESDDIEIITNRSGLSLSQIKIDINANSEDIVKMAKEIFTECALAFDIPKAVFLGEITEKADSTNEFITYAVDWIVEMLNDSLNAKFVGKEDYLKGEKIWVDMSKYKHVDIIESAANLDKLRSIGFNFDEVRTMVGWEELGTDFSQERVITKNYTDNLGGEENAENNSV